MPAGDGITFTYGDYSFDPRPLFTVNKEIIKTPSNSGLATKYSLTLNGTILPTGINLDDYKAGLNTVLSGTQALRDAFAQDFEVLLLKCDDTDPIISGYPKVISIDVSNAGDNYVRQATYTINLELPTLIGASYESAGLEDGAGNLTALGLVSLSDDVSIEFLDERAGGKALTEIFTDTPPTVFSINRNISAQGDSLAATGGATYMEPWERAQTYINDNLGSTEEFSNYFSGAMCIDGMNVQSTFRTISVNKTDGSCAGTQTFVAFVGTDKALEDFEGSSERSNETAFTSVTINGTIQGFDTIDYDECPTKVTSAKFDNAVTKWENISGDIIDRANKVYEASDNLSVRSDGELNIKPLSTTLGYNPIAGTVTYSFSYNDRLGFIDDNAISETISMTRNARPDLYASITILGRGSNGPLLQSLGATGPFTTDVSVDVLYKPDGTSENEPKISDWTGGDQDIPVRNDYNSLFTTPSDGFVTSDTITWDPSEGHYTRSKSWERGSC